MTVGRLPRAVCEVVVIIAALRMFELLAAEAFRGNLALHWLVLNCFLFAIVLAARAWLGGWRLREFGLRASLPRDVWAGVVGFSIGRLVATPVEILVLDRRVAVIGAELSASGDLIVIVATFVAGSFLPEILPREFLFRGYAQGLLASASSWGPAAVASAIAFSTSYAPMGADLALATLPDSAVMSLTYALTGSLVSVLVYHSLLSAAWAAEVAVYASAGRALGFVMVAVVFTASLLALVVLHSVGAEVFAYGLKKLGRPTRKDVARGAAAGVVISAALLVAQSASF